MLCKVLPRLHHKPFLRHCSRLRYHSCKARAAADLQSPISGRDSHTVFVCLSTHDHDDVHHYLMEDDPVFIVYLKKLEQRIPSCHSLWPGLASAAMKSKKLVKSLRLFASSYQALPTSFYAVAVFFYTLHWIAMPTIR